MRFCKQLLLAATLLTASCFSPPTPLCAFSCLEAPKACPSGYECRQDGYCHKAGTSGACPSFPAPDGATTLDASTDAQ